ncbi:alanine--tRNA ligase [Vampirovibrio chlorellavorus]|uniref:alanine--tRNA ligase n=1 Tax=Vampirovibrio chlorellavorus TaxID=758823 RepID=UPI0026EB44EC|nr:alanine--tRNA ligase [Vampirovibrio chlorellavorus]
MALSGTLSGATIREKFIRFFAEQYGHKHQPSASLVPSNPTVLLTPAGMLPFVPIFLGIEPPPNPPRVVSVQKCARVSGKASDLEFVGRTPRHHTFFEMLGNFSFGDYFKKEAITCAWQFVTGELGLPREKLWVTVFQDDDEARQLWHEIAGIPLNQIIGRGEKDNFWGPPGPTGPCGPCSEIFYDRGGLPAGSPESNPDLLDEDRFVEIWNLVFMQLFQDEAGKRTPLEHKNVDTGMGLERIAMVIQGKDNTFETDLLFPLVDQVSKLCKIPYKQGENTDVALKIVADHIRCISFAVADGITPSNEGRGYIIRMLLRRAVRYGKKYLGFQEPFLYQLVATVRNHYQNPYEELRTRYDRIVETVKLEEKRFLETLERGSKILDETLERLKAEGVQTVPGDDVFKLYDTYGFPLELTHDIAREEGFAIDQDGFEAALEAQRNKARSARGKGEAIVKDQLYSELLSRVGGTQFVGYETLSATATVKALIVDGEEVQKVAGTNQPFQAILDITPFYAESGGQVGDRGSFSSDNGYQGLTVVVNDVTKVGDLFVHHCLYDQGEGLSVGDTIVAHVDPVARQQAAIHHTATHLLQGALRNILGDSITQAGSQVSPDGARFDFTFNRGLKSDELARVEYLINKWIQENIARNAEVLPIEAARQSGAILMTGEKYGDEVRVISYGEASKELCGGTHVQQLGEIALVKIVSEGAIASGVRRIEIVAGEKAYRQFKQLELDMRDMAELLKSPTKEVPGKVQKLVDELKSREKTIRGLEEKLALQEIKGLQARLTPEHPVLVHFLKDYSVDGLKLIAEKLAKACGPHVIVLAGDADQKAAFVASVSEDYVKQGIKAGELVKQAAQICDGGGGGKPNFAQAGGKNPTRIQDALKAVETMLNPVLR